ncbi:MAG: hypothetical protein R6W06_02610 [Prochlorococcaceae cyanobacterium]
MQHFTAVEGLPEERITLAIAIGGFIGAPQQQIQRETGRACSADLSDLSQVITLKGHDHHQVGVRIPAAIAAGQGSIQDHLLRRKVGHQVPGEGIKRLSRHERLGHGHHPIVGRLRLHGDDCGCHERGIPPILKATSRSWRR